MKNALNTKPNIDDILNEMSKRHLALSAVFEPIVRLSKNDKELSSMFIPFEEDRDYKSEGGALKKIENDESYIEYLDERMNEWIDEVQSVQKKIVQRYIFANNPKQNKNICSHSLQVEELESQLYWAESKRDSFKYEIKSIKERDKYIVIWVLVMFVLSSPMFF